MMNFYEDIISQLTEFFKEKDPKFLHYNRHKAISNQYINFENPINCFERKKIIAFFLLERLISYKHRHIFSCKREVYISKELQTKLDSGEYNDRLTIISTIKSNLEKGHNVNDRLSRSVEKIGENDPMLYEWHIYHLHLGAEKDKSGFYNTTGPLLLVFLPDVYGPAYLVDITDNHHNNNIVFSKAETLEIIENNWPQLLAQFKLDGLEMEKIITDEQRLILRKKNANTFNTINGKVFANPGIGRLCNGASLEHHMKAQKIIKKIPYLENELKKEQKNFIPKQIPEYLNYKLEFDPKTLWFYIVEYAPNKTPKIVYEL